MDVKIELENGVMTAYVIGEIDHHTAKMIRETIDPRVESARPRLLIIDFAGVGFMDSSGIGLIMGRFKLMRSIGGNMMVTNPTPYVTKMMRLAGLDRLSVIQSVNEKRGGK